MTGFQVYDESGNLQIDSESLTHYLYSSGTVSTTTRAFGNTNPSSFVISVPTSVPLPIVAISSGYAFAQYGRVQNGSNWEYRFISAAPVSTSISYWVFASMQNTSASSPGIVVYDSSGNIVFNTANKPLRITGVLTTSSSSVTASGRTLAIACANFSGYRVITPGTWYYNGVPDVPPDDPPMADDWVQEADLDGDLYGGYVSGSTAYASSVSFDDVTIDYQDGYGTSLTTAVAWDSGYKPNLVIDVTNQ